MFVRGANPIWSFVDLIGQQLDDTYYISFLSNTFPYLPQAVYHDDQGLIPWSSPIQFLSNGTLDPDIFGDPNLVYRLEIRKGQTQFDPLIYVVNNYIFGDDSGTNPQGDNNEENQISNSQFSIVNFLDSFGNTESPNPQITISAAGTYEIAPGWEIVLEGSGSCTITQFITHGSENTPDNIVPPYYLDIVTSGWTSAILQQTLNGNGAIWYNNYIAASILVKSNDSLAHPISVSYVPNSPGVPVEIIASVPVSVGPFTYIQGIAALFPPANATSVNTTPNNEAFVKIQIALPSTGTIDISNIQLIGIQNNSDVVIDSFAIQPEETIERQLDHLAHYYEPKLAFKPIPSWLVGWDFLLNPTQFGVSGSLGAIGANKSAYAWDSTILFQSVNNSVSFNRDGQAGGFEILTNPGSKVAMVQYVQAPKANLILLSNMAVNLIANCDTDTTIKGTISLWYTTDASLPNIAAGTNNSLIATLDANGKPATFNGNWTEVPLKLGQEATFTLTSTITEFNFPFWEALSVTLANNAKFMAIVIGFQNIPASTIFPQIISCSLCSGDIATKPASQSSDEVLRECQYFFEKSYNPSTAIGSLTNTGMQAFNATLYNNTLSGGTTSELYPNQMNLLFKQEKRIAPSITVYSPTGASAQVQCGIKVGSSFPAPVSGSNPVNRTISDWSLSVSTSSAFISNDTGSGSDLIMQLTPISNAAVGIHYFHYIADARLGII